MRRFELSDAKSDKFWAIELDGTSFHVTFGKIGGKVLGLDARGWRRGPPQDAGVVGWYEKPIANGVVVSLDLDPGIFTGIVSESPEQTLGEISLTKVGYQKSGATFGELGPIVLSELARDLDALRG